MNVIKLLFFKVFSAVDVVPDGVGDVGWDDEYNVVLSGHDDAVQRHI